MSRKRTGRRAFLAGAATAAATTAIAAAVPLRHGRAQGAKIKVGLLLPTSGFQAVIGQDCALGAEAMLPVLKAAGYPEIELVRGDTESKVDIARAAAEKLIGQGCHVISGCFDSGQTIGAAQVTEQKGIPLVVNIAAAPQITSGQFKTVFRNFPTGPMIAGDAFLLQKELYALTGKAPKSAVMLHVNDTFGQSQRDATVNLIGRFDMPYKLVDTFSYDPQSRDLSAEVRKAKATGAELLWVISRLNDAILMTRELVKQRWLPMGIVSSGPGWYDDAYHKALGKLSEDVISTVPWFDPNKDMSKKLAAVFEPKNPDKNLNTNHTHTAEAMLIIADAFKRAGSTDPGKLMEALKATDIKNNITVGPGIKFDGKGQNPDTKNSAIQNRGGKLVSIVPVAAANGKPIWPMRDWDKRG
jgi:branched-chain amino acid transport system substrate-binding protein